MHLQLYSQTIREGESHQAIFNGSEAARGIIDVHIGTVFTLPQNFNQTINMLSMTDDGCYLYVILPLSSRVGDYLALVLFVPRQLLVAASADIPAIRDTMEHVLLNNSDAEPLRHFFEWDYPTLDIAIERNTDFNKYACLWLDDDMQSMTTFLSKPILYGEFLRYSGVFLLPPSYQEITNGETFPTFYISTLAAPLLHLNADNSHDSSHHDSNNQPTQDKKAKASDKKKNAATPHKGNKWLKWLWGLLLGIVLGCAAGFAIVKWLLPQEQTKPATTETVTNDASSDETTSDGTVSDETLSPDGTSSGDATDGTTGDEPIAPSTYSQPSNMDDNYDTDFYGMDDNDFIFDED